MQLFISMKERGLQARDWCEIQKSYYYVNMLLYYYILSLVLVFRTKGQLYN